MSSLNKSSPTIPTRRHPPSKLAISRSSTPKKTIRKPSTQAKAEHVVDMVDFGTFNTNTPEMNDFMAAYKARINALYMAHASASDETVESNKALVDLMRIYKKLELKIRFAMAKTLLSMKKDANDQKIKLWY